MNSGGMTDANHVSHTCDESIRPHLHQQHIAVAPKENLSGHLRRQLWGELQRANDDTAASHPSLIGQHSLFNQLHTLSLRFFG